MAQQYQMQINQVINCLRSNNVIMKVEHIPRWKSSVLLEEKNSSWSSNEYFQVDCSLFSHTILNAVKDKRLT